MTLLSSLLLALALLPSAGTRDAKSDWEALRTKDKSPGERIQAARSLLQRSNTEGDCTKTVADLVDFALKATTPRDLRARIAESLYKCTGEDTAKLLARQFGQGQAYEREFFLTAARGFHSAEIDKAIIAKGLTDDDPSLRRDAVGVLVFHKHAPAVPVLEKMLDSGKQPELVNAIVGGITDILTGTPGWAAWETRLVELGTGKDDEIRRSALEALAATKNVANLDVFVQALAHPDWSTRYLALGFLERANSKRAVTAIIEQMKREPPGSRMNSEIDSALERLSGMSFGDRAEDWAAWWKNNEAAFEFRPAGGPSTPDRKPSPRSDTAVAVKPKFYGIEIQTQRVCFVIDISGSMLEATKESAEGGNVRIDVAKRELDKIIAQLPPGSLFNIISFNADVDPWLDHVGDLPSGVDAKTRGKKSPSTGDARGKEKEKEPEVDPNVAEAQRLKEAEERRRLDDALRAKARAWVGKLKAAGGTNIYDALELAFEDSQVDTIFFLTDGEPSVGKKIEPDEIRADVKAWNATRKVRLNTIAIGAEFPLLRQLAQDNGGEYKHFP